MKAASPYDWLLERRVKKRDLPGHVVLVVTETDLLSDGFRVLDRFFGWCRELEVPRVTVYVSLLESNGELTTRIRDGIKDLGSDVAVKDHTDMEEVDGGYVVSIGYGGRQEFVHALQDIGRDVKEGRINVDEIDERTIEENLVFGGEPDVVLKTGGEHLTDFMIWQSVYSELYFADLNWHNFRKRDFLRALRDYQDRQRRYGQ